MSDNDFEKWWHLEGSTPPKPGQDFEEHTKEKCEIAWANGRYIALNEQAPLLGIIDFIHDEVLDDCDTAEECRQQLINWTPIILKRWLKNNV